jgi:thioredoxin 1
MLEITNDMDKISQDERAIVYFSAEWCGPCKQLKPQYAKLALQDESKNYYVVDVDKIDSKYLNKYSIKSIPQIFLMNNGEEVKRLLGRNYEDLNAEINSI